MTIRMDNLARNIRYDFLVSPRDRKTGIYVNGVGARVAPRNTVYQVFEEGAPYQWQHGRTMSDHGLVYLTEGGGFFRSRGTKELSVKAGDMLLLRPGVWHDYFPDNKTGWREYWVIFNGSQAGQLLGTAGLQQRTPVLRLGLDGRICRLFNEMIESAKENAPFINILLSGKLLELLAVTLGLARMQKEAGRQEHTIVLEARKHMELHFAEQIDMPALARSLNVSYRHFRRIFRASAGMPPHQHLLNLRMIQARRLLEEKNIKISTLAKMVGFDDPYYFSRIFKQKTGVAPARWRA